MEIERLQRANEEICEKLEVERMKRIESEEKLKKAHEKTDGRKRKKRAEKREKSRGKQSKKSKKGSKQGSETEKEVESEIEQIIVDDLTANQSTSSSKPLSAHKEMAEIEAGKQLPKRISKPTSKKTNFN